MTKVVVLDLDRLEKSLSTWNGMEHLEVATKDFLSLVKELSVPLPEKEAVDDKTYKARFIAGKTGWPQWSKEQWVFFRVARHDLIDQLVSEVKKKGGDKK